MSVGHSSTRERLTIGFHGGRLWDLAARIAAGAGMDERRFGFEAKGTSRPRTLQQLDLLPNPARQRARECFNLVHFPQHGVILEALNQKR